MKVRVVPIKQVKAYWAALAADKGIAAHKAAIAKHEAAIAKHEAAIAKLTATIDRKSKALAMDHGVIQ